MSSTLQAFGRTSHWSCCHAYDSAAGSRKRTRLATTGRNRLASESEQHAAPSVQARAAPLTWAYDLSTSEPTSPPSWQAARPTPAEEEQPHLDRKPLKINRDLLLVGTQSFAEPRTTAYKAKVAAAKAGHAETKAHRVEQHAVAEAALRNCIAMDATDGRGYVGLGKILISQRRYDEARKLYEDGSMATDGANAFIWQAWATLEARCGNINYARQLFDASVTANASHAAAWHGWGLLEKRQGNLLRARDLWLKGIRRTARFPNPFLYQSVAVLAGEMGLTKESRKWFQEATQTFKHGAGRHGIWQAWAQMEARQGDRKSVRYLLRKGLEAAPRSRYLHLTWALWEKELGQRDNARLLLRRGHGFNPYDPALLQALAIMEDEDGRSEQARALFHRASLADPHHVPVWQAWGCMEQRLGNLGRARELFQSGVWAEPGAPTVTTVWQAWAVLEAHARNHDLARQMFKCAVKADPSSKPSWGAWAAFELEQNNLERAQELEDLQRMSSLQIVWPRNFAAGFAPPSTMASPGISLDPILSTASAWFARFGFKGADQDPAGKIGAAAQRTGNQSQKLTETELEEAMARMHAANTPDLNLPEAVSAEFEAEWEMDAAADSARC